MHSRNTAKQLFLPKKFLFEKYSLDELLNHKALTLSALPMARSTTCFQSASFGLRRKACSSACFAVSRCSGLCFRMSSTKPRSSDERLRSSSSIRVTRLSVSMISKRTCKGFFPFLTLMTLHQLLTAPSNTKESGVNIMEETVMGNRCLSHLLTYLLTGVGTT